MASYLITGGAGFIGSTLASTLIARGHRVRVLDDLSTGHRARVPEGAELVVGDIADGTMVAEMMEGVDGCFHLAAIASVARCTEEWEASHRTNLSGTITVFHAAARAGVPVAYASSAAVYGHGAAAVLSETTPTAPRSAYGADKLGCELHARAAGIVHGLRSIGLRFFNVYGPGQDPSSAYAGVISRFLDAAAAGRTIIIEGDGGQTRDFVHVDDIVTGLIAALATADCEAPVLNLCTGQPTSIRALAALCAAAYDRPLVTTNRPPRAGDIRHSCGDATQAFRRCGWHAERTLGPSLRHMAELAQPV